MIVVIQGYFTPVWFLPLPSVCLLFINMCKCRPSYKFSSFLHINYVPSQCLASWVKICSSKLIKCLLPFVMSVSLLYYNRYNRLARSLLTLIGSCRAYDLFKIKAGRFRIAIVLAIALLGSNLFEFVCLRNRLTFYHHGFYYQG